MPLRIGIDVGGTKIEGIGLDGNREVARLRIAAARTYDATLDAIASVVASIEQQAGRSGSVGVGIPGALAPDTGLVKNANSVWLIGHPLRADLETTLDRPVRVENDANCFAISEAADGAAAAAAVVFGVIVGTGTGAGIVIRGAVLTGPNALAGEWGHNPLPWPEPDERPGPPCYCGKTGCIETFLSGPGMTFDYAARTGRRETPPTIVSRAKEGEAHAVAALDRYQDRMARALAAVVNVLDPDVVVLGGGMSNIDSLYRDVPVRLQRHVFGAVTSRAPGDQIEVNTAPAPLRTRLERAVHGDASGVRGAAWLWGR